MHVVKAPQQVYTDRSNSVVSESSVLLSEQTFGKIRCLSRICVPRKIQKVNRKPNTSRCTNYKKNTIARKRRNTNAEKRRVNGISLIRSVNHVQGVRPLVSAKMQNCVKTRTISIAQSSVKTMRRSRSLITDPEEHKNIGECKALVLASMTHITINSRSWHMKTEDKQNEKIRKRVGKVPRQMNANCINNPVNESSALLSKHTFGKILSRKTRDSSIVNDIVNSKNPKRLVNQTQSVKFAISHTGQDMHSSKNVVVKTTSNSSTKSNEAGGQHSPNNPSNDENDQKKSFTCPKVQKHTNRVEMHQQGIKN